MPKQTKHETDLSSGADGTLPLLAVWEKTKPDWGSSHYEACTNSPELSCHSNPQQWREDALVVLGKSVLDPI